MLDRKIVKDIKEKLSPKLRWLNFENKMHTKPDYLMNITGLKSMSDSKKLETMVREQLKADFPDIESMKSYELLVDAVMHNIRKKELGEL